MDDATANIQMLQREKIIKTAAEKEHKDRAAGWEQGEKAEEAKAKDAQAQEQDVSSSRASTKSRRACITAQCRAVMSWPSFVT